MYCIYLMHFSIYFHIYSNTIFHVQFTHVNFMHASLMYFHTSYIVFHISNSHMIYIYITIKYSLLYILYNACYYSYTYSHCRGVSHNVEINPFYLVIATNQYNYFQCISLFNCLI